MKQCNFTHLSDILLSTCPESTLMLLLQICLLYDRHRCFSWLFHAFMKVIFTSFISVLPCTNHTEFFCIYHFQYLFHYIYVWHRINPDSTYWINCKNWCDRYQTNRINTVINIKNKTKTKEECWYHIWEARLIFRLIAEGDIQGWRICWTNKSPSITNLGSVNHNQA